MLYSVKRVECRVGTELRSSPTGCYPCPGGTYRTDLSKPLCQFCPSSDTADKPEQCGGEWSMSLQGLDALFMATRNLSLLMNWND